MNRPCNDPCMGRTQIYGLSYDLCIQRKSFGVHSAMRTQKQQKCPYLINYSARISLFDKTTNLKLTTTTTKTKKNHTIFVVFRQLPDLFTFLYKSKTLSFQQCFHYQQLTPIFIIKIGFSSLMNCLFVHVNGLQCTRTVIEKYLMIKSLLPK